MDKAQHNERPTDIVLTGTLREEAKRASLRRNFNAKSYLLLSNPYNNTFFDKINIITKAIAASTPKKVPL